MLINNQFENLVFVPYHFVPKKSNLICLLTVLDNAVLILYFRTKIK